MQPSFCSCSPGAAREGPHSEPRLWQRSPWGPPCPGDIVSVTMGREGTGQTLHSDFSQTLLDSSPAAAELHPMSLPCGDTVPPGMGRSGSGAQRSPGKDPQPWGDAGSCPCLLSPHCGRCCWPCSRPALPVPNLGRGWQEWQALLCQQPPRGKDPSSFSPQPWAASRMHLERVEDLAGAGRSWQWHSGTRC